MKPIIKTKSKIFFKVLNYRNCKLLKNKKKIIAFLLNFNLIINKAISKTNNVKII